MNDNELMKVESREEFIKNFKAVYNAMTAKPESKSRVFHRNVVVKLSDIYELNQIIVDKFKTHYDDAGFSINVTVDFQGNKSLEFTTWLDFENYKFREIDYIRSITIKWEYYAKLPQFKVPQKHTLVVKLTDELRAMEVINLIFSGSLEDMREIEAKLSPVVARVDFINSLLGDELLALVDNWDKGLEEPRTMRSKFIKFLSANKRKIAYIFNFVALLIISFCTLTMSIKSVEKYGWTTLGDVNLAQAYEGLYVILGIVLVGALVYKISDFLLNVFFNVLIDDDDYNHVFAITRGDEKKQKEIEKHYKNSILKIFLSLLGNFLIDLIGTIIIGGILHT